MTDPFVAARKMRDVLDRPSIDEVLRLLGAAEADNARLRALVKQVECTLGSSPGCCPWCGCYVVTPGTHATDDSCPAFTPEGAVR